MAGLFGLGGPSLPKDKRDLVDSLSGEFDALRVAEEPRLQRYKTYREENQAARKLDLASAARGGDYGRDRRDAPPERHQVVLPFGQALTVKHAVRIAGRLPDAIVDRREETPEERYRSDTMEKMWWGILHASGGDTVIGSAAWDASQLGAACFDCYLHPQTQIPIIRALDPTGVLIVKGVDDPHDFQRVYRFWQVSVAELQAQYRDKEFGDTGILIPVEDIASSDDSSGVPMATVVEMCDKERTIRFALGAKQGDSVPLFEHEHGLGFAPYVVVPNIGPYRDVWGWADYEFVRALVAYIPALFSRKADILRMVANGAYKSKGTGQDPKTEEAVLAHGGVLPMKRDGDLEPIDPPDIPNFADSHSEEAVAFLKMLGFAPDAAWGDGNAGSGSDRGLQLQPLLELDVMKQTNWSASLSRLASYCFRLIEKKQLPRTKAVYRGIRPGVTSKTTRPFPAFTIGPDEPPFRDTVEGVDEFGNATKVPLDLPRTPRELFDGDYTVRFVWQNRIDPDDPAFALAELNKFVQGAQSLETTLERLGVQFPEDEMKRIEQEAERFPWLRQGMIALIQAQLREMAAASQGGGPGSGQGEGGGRPPDVAGSLLNGLGMTQTKDGRALDQDATTAALPGGGIGAYTGTA